MTNPIPMPTSVSAVVDPAAFKRAMACFATGVTVVTTRDALNQPVGLTVSSFNSVSLQPPLVLWSLTKTGGSLPVFQQCSHYAINVLTDQQLMLSRQFSQRGVDRFAGVATQTGLAGMPLLTNCLAWFVCRNRSQYDEGDHVIFVGEVEACAAFPGQPLVHHNSNYFVTRTHPDIP